MYPLRIYSPRSTFETNTLYLLLLPTVLVTSVQRTFCLRKLIRPQGKNTCTSDDKFARPCSHFGGYRNRVQYDKRS